jgi:hypothetical protein
MLAVVRLVVGAAQNDGFRAGLILTALAFGFRHGFDWDHLAAIGDLAGPQTKARRAVGLATLYVLGHALVVLVLGVLAVVFASRLPAGIDDVMERVVGLTLLLLGGYVLVALARRPRGFRMRSRATLVIAGVRALRGSRAVEPVATGASHGHPGSAAVDPLAEYAGGTAFGVGVLHAVGAETPTQVLIFLTAAGAAGRATGLLLLGCFVVGLVAANTVVTVALTSGSLLASRSATWYLGLSAVTGAASLALGAILVAGASSRLPILFGV